MIGWNFKNMLWNSYMIPFMIVSINHLTANMAEMFLTWSFNKCLFLCRKEIKNGHRCRTKF